MNPRSRAIVAAVLPCFLAVGCGSAPTDPPVAEDVLIVVHTTGGIAARNWIVTLDGAAREIRCSAPCPWSSETTRAVAEGEVEELAEAFVDAGVRHRRSTDFGLCAGCSDQFHHDMTYRDGTGTYQAQGDGPNLPDGLAAAVHRIIFPPFPE